MIGQGGGGTAQGVSPGVVGNAGTSAPNDGVQGFGDATNGAASGIGVFAVGGAPAPGSSQPGGPGVHAIGAGGAPFTPLNQAVGVYGLGGAGDAAGVLGQGGSAVADGVRGFSTSGSAISGESTNGVGVRAFSSSGTGVVAEGNRLVPGTIGLIATGNAFAAQFNGKVLINGDLTVTGAVPHFSRTRVTMASDAAATLSSAESNAQILEVVSSASLTSTRKVALPLTDGTCLIVYNGTMGGKSLEFIGSSGSGVTVGNGKRAIIYCDGANWNRVTADA